MGIFKRLFNIKEKPVSKPPPNKNTNYLSILVNFIDWFGQSDSDRFKLSKDDLMSGVRAAINVSFLLFVLKVLESIAPWFASVPSVKSWIIYIIMVIIIQILRKYIAGKIIN